MKSERVEHEILLLIIMRIILFIFYIFCSVSGVIFMKYGGVNQNVASILIMGIRINIFTLAGIILYGTGFLLWMYLVQKFDLSKLLPFVMAIFNITTILLSVLLFEERLSFVKCVGIGIIIIGVIIISL